jgi:hypothetical protein
MWLSPLLAVFSVAYWQPTGGAGAQATPNEEARAAGSAREVAEPSESARELLELALDAASAFPLDPHIKNRSRAQAEVVTAWLALGQPQRAAAAAAVVLNWRRGMGLADVAWHHAQRGETGEAVRYIDVVREMLEAPIGPDEQEWRRERVRARVDQAEALLLVGEASSARPSAAAVAAEMARLRELAPNAPFETLQVALDGAVRTFAAIYDDPELRNQVAAAIAAAVVKMPNNLVIDLDLAMAGHALDHGDTASARQRLSDIRSRVDRFRWLPEALVPVCARIAELRHRAGEEAAAIRDLEDALAAYRAGRDRIVDIWRAGALRPVAEAYQAIGDPASAVMVWKFAVAEGSTNPNSRPRCDDLVATCCSIAVAGGVPDAELMARLREVRAGLKAPW